MAFNETIVGLKRLKQSDYEKCLDLNINYLNDMVYEVLPMIDQSHYILYSTSMDEEINASDLITISNKSDIIKKVFISFNFIDFEEKFVKAFGFFIKKCNVDYIEPKITLQKNKTKPKISNKHNFINKDIVERINNMITDIHNIIDTSVSSNITYIIDSISKSPSHTDFNISITNIISDIDCTKLNNLLGTFPNYEHTIYFTLEKNYIIIEFMKRLKRQSILTDDFNKTEIKDIIIDSNGIKYAFKKIK